MWGYQKTKRWGLGRSVYGVPTHAIIKGKIVDFCLWLPHVFNKTVCVLGELKCHMLYVDYLESTLSKYRVKAG